MIKASKHMQTLNTMKTTKKVYSSPKVEQIKLDTEISLVMTSVDNDNSSTTPPPEFLIGNPVQKIFKLFWNPNKLMYFGYRLVKKNLLLVGV